jgi:hypothetical protein
VPAAQAIEYATKPKTCRLRKDEVKVELSDAR